MRKIMRLFLPIIIALLIQVPVKANTKDTYISETAQEACIEYGELYGICPELLMAIIERESAGHSDAENEGCKGLMQVSEKFHKNRMERLGVDDLYDECGNILVGTGLSGRIEGRASGFIRCPYVLQHGRN